MKVRQLAVAAACAATAIPIGSASAVPTHCISEVSLAGRTVWIAPVLNTTVATPSVNYRAAECQFTESPFLTEIKPGTNSLRLQLSTQQPPAYGTLTFAGRTYALSFAEYAPTVGDPGDIRWASPWYYFDPNEARVATHADALMCSRKGELEFCQAMRFNATPVNPVISVPDPALP